MSKAEERAQAAYPAWRNGLYDEFNSNSAYCGFIKGYHQAEKDLELTWKDFTLIRLAFDATEADINLGSLKISPMTKEYYQEVLKRFKDFKERKEK